MATAEKLPFSWHSVESLPDLERLRLVLDTLPDDEIVAALEAGRGRGRNNTGDRNIPRLDIAVDSPQQRLRHPHRNGDPVPRIPVPGQLHSI